jgi:hypothetical protein
MTIDAKCAVCKNPDRRRMIELGWNGGMSGEAMSRVIGDKPTAQTILKHLKEHADGDGNARAVEIEPELPVRDRIVRLREMQLDEVERRIALAKARAAQINAEHESEPDWEPRDWSDFYDILDKDTQAAIGSILKSQGLSDKREKAVGDLKLGLFEAMQNAGLAPKALVGGREVKVLEPEGDDDELDG